MFDKGVFKTIPILYISGSPCSDPIVTGIGMVAFNTLDRGEQIGNHENPIFAINVQQCPICQTFYWSTRRDKQHERIEDNVVHGFKVERFKNEKVIYENGDSRVTLVDHRSSKGQKFRVVEVKEIARLETKFTVAYEPSKEQAFLLHRDDRIIGLVMLQPCSNSIRKCAWNKYPEAEPESGTLPGLAWSVGFIWIHRSHRRRKEATRLLDVAARFVGTDTSLLVWTTPFTESGAAWVKSICPQTFYVA